jgi:hypothetical protein
MASIVESVKAEYERYKALAEATFAQLDDAQLSDAPPGAGNSVATIVWHVSGNLRSRFTDFLTSDGEKPWRKRDEEFETRAVSRAEVLAKWEQGWGVLLKTLGGLRDDQLKQPVVIRGQSMEVFEALQRSVAHTSYHVGQIVFLGKMLKADSWKYLSIPPGQSDAYNKNPGKETPAGHAAALKGGART